MNTEIRVVATAFAAALSLTAATGSAFGQDVTLQYHWTNGEEIRQRFVFQSLSTTGGLPGNVTGELDTRLSQVVRTVVDDVAPDGTATLRTVFESMRWETKGTSGTMVFDTESTTEPASANVPFPLKEMMNSFVGQALTVVMAPSGQVQKVDGMSRIVDKAVQSAPPSPLTASLLESLRSGFSDDQLQNVLTRGSIRFPDRPLRLGDTWDTSATMTNPMTGAETITTVFTLKDVEDNSGRRIAVIATRITFQNTGGPAAAAVTGLKMRVTDSSGEGEMVFDVTNGRLLRSTTRTKNSADMEMSRPDGVVMNLQTTSVSTISVEQLQPQQ